jgi:hypothetical protein
MAELIQTIETEFSIADAEYPEFTLRNSKLELSFVDWQKKPVVIQFDDVMAVKWQEAESLSEGEPFDGACLIEHSQWLDEHERQCGLNSDHRYKHFKFNFNACGSLEVICSGFHRKCP